MSFIESLFSVKDKVILITGTSSGIGLKIAESLHRSGARVIGCSRRLPRDKEIFYDYFNVDLKDYDSIIKCLDQLNDKYDNIDVLINAAGTTIEHSDQFNLHKFSEIFDQTISVNMKAPFLFVEGLKKIIKKNTGSIINITSIAQSTGFPNNPSYLASKGGLAQMTKAYAFDLALHGIRVNNIAPGYIYTEMTEKSYNNKELNKIRERNTLLNRWGNSDDIVGAAIFLASNASAYVTGTTLFIDGGWLAKGMV